MGRRGDSQTDEEPPEPYRALPDVVVSACFVGRARGSLLFHHADGILGDRNRSPVSGEPFDGEEIIARWEEFGGEANRERIVAVRLKTLASPQNATIPLP